MLDHTVLAIMYRVITKVLLSSREGVYTTSGQRRHSSSPFLALRISAHEVPIPSLLFVACVPSCKFSCCSNQSLRGSPSESASGEVAEGYAEMLPRDDLCFELAPCSCALTKHTAISRYTVVDSPVGKIQANLQMYTSLPCHTSSTPPTSPVFIAKAQVSCTVRDGHSVRPAHLQPWVMHVRRRCGSGAVYLMRRSRLALRFR